ncbi:MAG: hypothetical protein AB1Z23_09750 [Eubacteriales bacterium]
MSSKKWTLSVLGLTAGLVILIASFIFIVDPFFCFREPKEYGYSISNEIYQNPGVVRNYEFNSVILGSSMCENFRPSEFDNKFSVSTVKLTYAGGYPLNYKYIMDTIKEYKDLEVVFWGMDITTFATPSNQTRFPLPEYLYDQNRLNDINYLLNKDIILYSLDVVRKQIAGVPTTDIDDAYEWYSANANKFNTPVVAENLLDMYNLAGKSDAQISSDEYFYLVKENFEKNIVPIIESNPETEFYIFFPPYSIVFWKVHEKAGDLDEYIYSLEYITENLLIYDNIEVYSFQDVESIVCDISLYKDHTHYLPSINDFILENMDNPKYQITKENYKNKIEDLQKLIVNTNVVELLESYTE